MDNKCDATGKTIYTSISGAKSMMFKFRHRFWDNVTGKRRNRNCKKPTQKRVYLCQYCGGYHQTSMDHYKE